MIRSSCISFDSYIKPQPPGQATALSCRCISFDSYIKPQPCRLSAWLCWVVYLLIPTSNHNAPPPLVSCSIVVYLLIPTSNHNLSSVSSLPCLVVYLLIPTSNHNPAKFITNPDMLYIFWFLHQTTTSTLALLISSSCISFDSYIKPQLRFPLVKLDIVVYLLIPTSNHNYAAAAAQKVLLYIFWFLHQTTTTGYNEYHQCSCISFDSYIKPQPRSPSGMGFIVVYLLIPTSNHNMRLLLIDFIGLYIFWFLHQTTTITG